MRKYLVFLLALLITLSAAVYQRLTGPTHPLRFSYTADSITYKAKLPRSGNSDADTRVALKLPVSSLASIYFKKYKVSEDYTSLTFFPSDENTQEAFLPKMPAAAKLEYYLEITDGAKTTTYFKENPIVIRYKDPVPVWALIPHIIIMFLAMLFSNLSGLQAIFRIPAYKRNTVITLALLFLGGLILGPIVQKYAFGEFWTGFPLGYDLTDNKTLIAFVTWLVAFIVNRKQDRPSMVIFASFITIAVFSVPHSLFGSELNYETGKVVTGFIQTVLH